LLLLLYWGSYQPLPLTRNPNLSFQITSNSDSTSIRVLTSPPPLRSTDQSESLENIEESLSSVTCLSALFTLAMTLALNVLSHRICQSSEVSNSKAEACELIAARTDIASSFFFILLFL